MILFLQLQLFSYRHAINNKTRCLGTINQNNLTRLLLSEQMYTTYNKTKSSKLLKSGQKVMKYLRRQFENLNLKFLILLFFNL